MADLNTNSVKLVKSTLNDKYADFAAKGKVELFNNREKKAFKSVKIKTNNDFGHLFTNLSLKMFKSNQKYIMYAFEQKNTMEVVYRQFKM